MIQLTSIVRALIVLVILHLIAFLIERRNYREFIDGQEGNTVTYYPSFWGYLTNIGTSCFTKVVLAIDIAIVAFAIAFWVIYPTIK